MIGWYYYYDIESIKIGSIFSTFFSLVGWKIVSDNNLLHNKILHVFLVNQRRKKWAVWAQACKIFNFIQFHQNYWPKICRIIKLNFDKITENIRIKLKLVFFASWLLLCNSSCITLHSTKIFSKVRMFIFYNGLDAFITLGE